MPLTGSFRFSFRVDTNRFFRRAREEAAYGVDAWNETSSGANARIAHRFLEQPPALARINKVSDRLFALAIALPETGVKPVAIATCLIVTPFSHIVACQLVPRERGST